MADEHEYLYGLLASEFEQIRADRKIKGAEEIDALVACVGRPLDSVATIHFQGCHTPIEIQERNMGDISLGIDANGHIASIDIEPGKRIADLEFWVEQ